MRTAVPQAFLHASADAAAGVAGRAAPSGRRAGCGQHVEVSAQRSMMQATQSYVLAVPLGGTAAQRMSGGVKTGGLDVQLLWPCKDGFVSVTFLFGASIGPFTASASWTGSTRRATATRPTRDKDWLDYANLLYDGARADRGVRAREGGRRRVLRGKTKAELLEAACDASLLIAPVATPDDVVAQRPVRGPRLLRRGRRRGAVAGARRSARRARGCARRPHAPRPPRSGAPPRRAHRRGAGRRAASAARTVCRRRRRCAPSRRSTGIKVLDLTWAMAGPATTRVMADFGATVVRVETAHHLDVARTIGPFVDDTPGNDSGGLLFNMTTGKRSVSSTCAQPLAARCSTTSCAGPTS